MDLLHAANLRHGTDGFTYPPKEGVLKIFICPLKIWRLRPGLNPRTWIPKASTLPLDHRSRFSLRPYCKQNIIFALSVDQVCQNLICVWQCILLDLPINDLGWSTSGKTASFIQSYMYLFPCHCDQKVRWMLLPNAIQRKGRDLQYGKRRVEP